MAHLKRSLLITKLVFLQNILVTMSNPLSTGQQHIPLFEYMPTHEHHYRFPFHFIRIFTPPELRVKWGKNHDEHPIVDWGELFYDLFFVAVSHFVRCDREDELVCMHT